MAWSRGPAISFWSSKSHGLVSSAGRAVSDNSHMTHFLTWRSATVAWEADRCTHDQGHLDAAVRPRPRPCVVFRAVGAVRRGHCRRLSDRRRGDAMIAANPYLVVRAASIYITAMLTIAAWLIGKRVPGLFRAARKRLPEPFSPAGCWHLPGICRSCSSLNVAGTALRLVALRRAGRLAAGRTGRFSPRVGVAVERRSIARFSEALGLGAIAIVALAFDLVLMPAAAPVVRLGRHG